MFVTCNGGCHQQQPFNQLEWRVFRRIRICEFWKQRECPFERVEREGEERKEKSNLSYFTRTTRSLDPRRVHLFAVQRRLLNTATWHPLPTCATLHFNSRSIGSLVCNGSVGMLYPTLEPPLQKVGIDLNEQIRQERKHKGNVQRVEAR